MTNTLKQRAREMVESILDRSKPLDNSFLWREEVAQEIVDTIIDMAVKERNEEILKQIDTQVRITMDDGVEYMSDVYIGKMAMAKDIEDSIKSLTK